MSKPALTLAFVALALVAGSAVFLSVPTSSEAVTYHDRVSRIIQENCVMCHRDGGIAPFSLESYEAVSTRAPMIAFMVSQGRMPPWFASPEYGRWANDRSLSEADRLDLLSWIEAGAPAGDPDDAPPPREFVEGWMLGEAPDTVIPLPEVQEVPADGVLDYRYLYVKTDFPEDRWIQKAELRPTGREVAHHSIVFQEGPDDEERGPWIVAWAPGLPPSVFPAGTGKLLPAGGWLMFQMHYTTMGRPATDRTELALVFADETPRRRVRTLAVGTTDFEIPAGAENHEVVAELEFEDGGEIISLLPHMHYRGKAFRYELVHEDGREEVLLDVPAYDFNWQLSYVAAEPIVIRPGMVLRGRAWYDNSERNPANPDPGQSVAYGEQSFEEMMFGFFEWVPAQEDDRRAAADGGG
jgi:mono/diheme cytochrome c family protein